VKFIIIKIYHNNGPRIPFQGENSQISFDLTSSKLKIKKKGML